MRKLIFIVIPVILTAIAMGIGWTQQRSYAQAEQQTLIPANDQSTTTQGASTTAAPSVPVSQPSDVSGGQTITGKIEDVALDGTSVTINGQKIITTKDMVEEAYFEKDDKVEITVQKQADGSLRAMNYRYIFDEESDILPKDNQLNPSESLNKSVPSEDMAAQPVLDKKN